MKSSQVRLQFLVEVTYFPKQPVGKRALDDSTYLVLIDTVIGLLKKNNFTEIIFTTNARIQYTGSVWVQDFSTPLMVSKASNSVPFLHITLYFTLQNACFRQRLTQWLSFSINHLKRPDESAIKFRIVYQTLISNRGRISSHQQTDEKMPRLLVIALSLEQIAKLIVAADHTGLPSSIIIVTIRLQLSPHTVFDSLQKIVWSRFFFNFRFQQFELTSTFHGCVNFWASFDLDFILGTNAILDFLDKWQWHGSRRSQSQVNYSNKYTPKV